MTAWLLAHRNAALQALRRLWGAPLGTVLSLLGIGIALALPTGGYLLLSQAAALTKSAAATPRITLFLTLGAERKEAQALETRLRERGDVARTQLLAREETLARMKEAEGLGDVVAALPKNPFPDALVVTPVHDSPAALAELADAVRKWPGVEHVQTDAAWAHRLGAFMRLAHLLLALLAGLLGIGLVAITFNTIRLQGLTCQVETEVSRLLGATEAFIRRPFLWHGSLLGCLGGMTAWLIVAAMILWLRSPIAALAALYELDIHPALPSLAESAALLCGATLLGWLGAALSMGRQGTAHGISPSGGPV